MRHEHRVDPHDLDPDGRVTNEALERWTTSARAAYLAQCQVLAARQEQSGLEPTSRIVPPRSRTRMTGASAVVVSASATEVFPDSFVVAVRMRPIGGEDEDPFNVACIVRLEHPGTGEVGAIDDEIRDELIALEHAARHFN